MTTLQTCNLPKGQAHRAGRETWTYLQLATHVLTVETSRRPSRVAAVREVSQLPSGNLEPLQNSKCSHHRINWDRMRQQPCLQLLPLELWKECQISKHNKTWKRNRSRLQMLSTRHRVQASRQCQPLSAVATTIQD